MEKKEVIQAVKQELSKLYGKRLSKILLYGSYARGDFHDDSDIDFLVVFNDDEVQVGTEIRRMRQSLSRLDAQYNAYISAHPTTLKKLEQSGYIFYQLTLRTPKSLGKQVHWQVEI